MSESTDRLISGLVDGLEPVAPVPRLRSACGVVWLIWVLFSGFILWSKPAAPVWSEWTAQPFYPMSLLALLAAAFGGTLSALASGQPGRAGSERLGLAVCAGGLLAAAVACLLGMSSSGSHTGGEIAASTSWLASLSLASPSHAAADLMCLRRGMLMALVPAVVFLPFLARGWTTHPMRAAWVCATAVGALGAVTIHSSCGLLEPGHWLVGHLGIPVVLSLVSLYPLGLWLKRRRG